MARTVAEVLTSAGRTLNDEDSTRYTEAERIGFVVDAINAIKTARPDLFIGLFSTPVGTLTTASNLPIDDQFFRPLVDYVIGRCESKDDESVVSARAELMFKLAGSYLS